MAPRPPQQRQLPKGYKRVQSLLEPHKDEIYKLYIEQNKELSDVITCIRINTGVDQS